MIVHTRILPVQRFYFDLQESFFVCTDCSLIYTKVSFVCTDPTCSLTQLLLFTDCSSTVRERFCLHPVFWMHWHVASISVQIIVWSFLYVPHTVPIQIQMSFYLNVVFIQIVVMILFITWLCVMKYIQYWLFIFYMLNSVYISLLNYYV